MSWSIHNAESVSFLPRRNPQHLVSVAPGKPLDFVDLMDIFHFYPKKLNVGRKKEENNNFLKQKLEFNRTITSYDWGDKVKEKPKCIKITEKKAVNKSDFSCSYDLYLCM